MATAAMVVEENFMIALFDRCFLTVVSCLDERYYEEMHSRYAFHKILSTVWLGKLASNHKLRRVGSEWTEQTVFLDIGISENNNLPRHSSSIPLCPCSFSFASLPLLLDSSNHFLLPTVLPSYLPTDSPSDQWHDGPQVDLLALPRPRGTKKECYLIVELILEAASTVEID